MSVVINLDNTTPAAPSGSLNGAWLKAGTSSGTDPSSGLPIYDASVSLPKFTGDAGSGGALGLVPAPAAGDAAAGKYLRADATWAVPTGSGGGTTHSESLTDGNGNFIFASTPTLGGDVITVVGVPD